jgi:hypothetical protein
MKVECRVPDSESTRWKIETFVVNSTDAKFFNFQNRGRYIKPGAYKRLILKGFLGGTMMSNTPAEIYDHMEFSNNAKGHILINGLGLGIVLEMVLNNPEVTKITVIEKDPEIIQLVAPFFANEPKIEIICADAFDYQPPKGIRYGAVWHDIWMNICSDNLPEMTKLHRKYGKKTDWQGSWCKEECIRWR